MEQDTMSESNTTIVAEQNKTTENYAVYGSAEVAGSQDLTGMYVSLATFPDAPMDFIEVTVGEADELPVTLEKSKDTKSFGVYESASGAISGVYIDHDILGSEDGEAPENRSISIAPATEDDFEESQQSEELEAEAGALLSEAGSEDAVEAEVEESDEEETPEESEAADLLEEAEEAAAE